MDDYNEIGFQTRVVATGSVAIGVSGKNYALLGILVGSGSAAPSFNIWNGLSQGVASTLIGTITAPLNAYLPIRAYCTGGMNINVSGDANPDLTIFWKPVG